MSSSESPTSTAAAVRGIDGNSRVKMAGDCQDVSPYGSQVAALRSHQNDTWRAALPQVLRRLRQGHKDRGSYSAAAHLRAREHRVLRSGEVHGGA